MTTPATQEQMTEIEQTPRYVIGQWQNKEIDGTTLMRRLMAWQRWNVAISESAAVEMLATNAATRIMYSRDPQGVGRLFLYSDSAAYAIFCKQAGVESEQHFLTTSGDWIFRLTLEGISEIVIDPYTPTEIVYTQEQFARLREMANAVQVEDALTNLRYQPETADAMIPLVRDYPRYLLAVNRVSGGMVLAMAPDSQGRELAAVFTSTEAFDAFYPEGKHGYPDGDLLILTLSGIELFSQLGKMNLDGMVFNCKGPVRPIAFAAGIAQVILDSISPPELAAD
ncbi:MAG: hypothetical protein JWL77_6298 [Chthonomonadaceae bacterium]|nr:hypothetical protein [Chthonomonadaceae bacterium]